MLELGTSGDSERVDVRDIGIVRQGFDDSIQSGQNSATQLVAQRASLGVP